MRLVQVSERRFISTEGLRDALIQKATNGESFLMLVYSDQHETVLLGNEMTTMLKWLSYQADSDKPLKMVINHD